MIEKQKKEAGEALVSVVLFDGRTEVIYDRVDIKQIQSMTDEQYFVRGCTALLDAMGVAISHIKNVRKRMPESERPEKTIFIITIDGMENASHRYNYAKNKRNDREMSEEKLGIYLSWGKHRCSHRSRTHGN